MFETLSAVKDSITELRQELKIFCLERRIFVWEFGINPNASNWDDISASEVLKLAKLIKRIREEEL